MELKLNEDISVRKTNHSGLGEVTWDALEFGKYNSDHMLVCDYYEDRWQAPHIIPFASFSLSPVALALHYGQTVFEGMKAYRMKDGRINIFRPDKHYRRLARSAERLCMPVVAEELFIRGLRQLVELDRDWIPLQAGSALYIRPFILATEAGLGVKTAREYRFAIVTGPTGPYYGQPVRVIVETGFTRASKGGTGYAKCGGNYGASLYPAQKAKEQGYDQVLWTDGKEHKYIEEAGTMNVLFVIGGRLITPALSDSILDGVTRASFLSLARREGIPVEERPLSVDEMRYCFENGTLTEAFGAGTASVSVSIKTIRLDGIDYELPAAGRGGIAELLKNKLTKIRNGEEADPFGWNYTF